MCDGTFIAVYTLSPEDIIAEKVLAYKKRRKVRDLYDIFFLLRFVKTREKIRMGLKKLLEDFEQPVDVNDLKVLIIWGVVPSVDDMLKEVKKWAE
jgi:predicted nucleotidyltransferase component of viral defense system